MNDLKRLLFKRNKPVLRDYVPLTDKGPGDAPYLWDAYLKDKLNGAEPGMTMPEFAEYLYEVSQAVSEIYILEDYVGGELHPIAVVFCNNDGWQLEPHVVYFDNATPRTILRTYVAFLKKTKWRKDIGAVLIRSEKDGTNLANRVEKMGLIEWVGKVWGGRPGGNEYLYSMRCNAGRK
ncbi:MAG: hypothetical protein ACR2QW_05420 [bacterium]